MFCKGSTVAKKRYQRDSLRFMAAYVAVLLGSSWFVKHDGGEKFFLYFLVLGFRRFPWSA